MLYAAAGSRAMVAPLLAEAAAALALLVAAAPLFKQCDPRWGNATMGVEGPGEQSSICGEGCAMSCVAMVGLPR